MVIVDHLSKCTHMVPKMSGFMASGVSWLFRNHVWKLHSLPEEVIHDRGTQFILNFTCTFSQLLGIMITESTPYHLQTDGQTEQVTQEVKQFLRLFMNQFQDD